MNRHVHTVAITFAIPLQRSLKPLYCRHTCSCKPQFMVTPNF